MVNTKIGSVCTLLKSRDFLGIWLSEFDFYAHASQLEIMWSIVRYTYALKHPAAAAPNITFFFSP